MQLVKLPVETIAFEFACGIICPRRPGLFDDSKRSITFGAQTRKNRVKIHLLSGEPLHVLPQRGDSCGIAFGSHPFEFSSLFRQFLRNSGKFRRGAGRFRLDLIDFATRLIEQREFGLYSFEPLLQARDFSNQPVALLDFLLDHAEFCPALRQGLLFPGAEFPDVFEPRGVRKAIAPDLKGDRNSAHNKRESSEQQNRWKDELGGFHDRLFPFKAIEAWCQEMVPDVAAGEPAAADCVAQARAEVPLAWAAAEEVGIRERGAEHQDASEIRPAWEREVGR